MHFLAPGIRDEEIFEILLNQKGKIVNKYPGVKELARKDNFDQIMRLASVEDPEAFDFIPRTFVFPQDEKDFLQY